MTVDPTSSVHVQRLVADFLASHPPARTEQSEFLRARYDAGLAWVHFPEGHGGLGLPRERQATVDALLRSAGAPDNDPQRNGIGLAMAAPAILAFGTEEQRRRFLRPLWTGEHVWCQLFSEPGAGSDLAAVATRATRDGDAWIVTGQKVWTSTAHNAKYAILLARTNPALPKHAGLTFFLCDMTDPGVNVRPLRQITGEAEFNEVFLTNVRIPDGQRLGAEGQGWTIAKATLNRERVVVGGGEAPREGGMAGVVARTWREHPRRRTPDLHARLMSLWVEAEVARLTGLRHQQRLALGQPGPEGSVIKLMFAQISQRLSSLEVELLGDEGLRYSSWTLTRPERIDFTGRDAGYRYLRARGNSIEGGTSEILLNVIAERVLGLPGDPRVDKDTPWTELEK